MQLNKINELFNQNTIDQRNNKNHAKKLSCNTLPFAANPEHIAVKTTPSPINKAYLSAYYGLKLSPISFAASTENKAPKTALSCLPDANIKEITEKINLEKKQPLVISDFDGTFSAFTPKILEAGPYGGVPNFSAMVNNLDKSNIPFFILTSRKLEDFSEPGMLGDAAENINKIGLKGNQMNLILPKTPKVDEFISKWQEKNDYTTEIKELNNGKIKIKVEPKPIEGFDKVKTQLKDELEPLGFAIEDKKIMFTLHWRDIEEKINNSKEPYRLEVNNEIFQDVNNWKKIVDDKEEKESKVLIINKGNPDKNVELSSNELLDYSKQKFENICKDNFTNELKQGKVSLHLDTGTKIYELVDARTTNLNKGTILKDFTDLFGGNEKAFPIFMGDSISTGKDDEFALEESVKSAGAGIAVVCRDKTELGSLKNPDISLTKRLSLETSANYKLDSYQETVPFLNKLAGEYSKQKS